MELSGWAILRKYHFEQNGVLALSLIDELLMATGVADSYQLSSGLMGVAVFSNLKMLWSLNLVATGEA